MRIIDKHKDRLNRICGKYNVASLFAFGSILTSDFKNDSDIDFVVYFKPIPVLDYADNFFDFMQELESTFQRKVDLVSGKAMKNPYFIEEVERTKQLVYGKGDKEIIV